MRRITRIVLFVVMAASFSRPAIAQEPERFFGRFSFFRFRDNTDNTTGTTTTTNTTATTAGRARLRDQVLNSEQPNLDEIREVLLQRGFEDRTIEERLARVVEDRQDGRYGNRYGYGGYYYGKTGLVTGRSDTLDLDSDRRLSLDQVRTNLQERGFDTAQIDDQIVRLTAVRARVDSERFGRNNRGAILDLDLNQVRTQLEQSGLNEAEVNSRLAILQQSEFRSVGGIRNRYRQQGLTQREADERVNRLLFGITPAAGTEAPRVLFAR